MPRSSFVYAAVKQKMKDQQLPHFYLCRTLQKGITTGNPFQRMSRHTKQFISKNHYPKTSLYTFLLNKSPNCD